MKNFDLGGENTRLQFARELYNLCSEFASQSGSRDIQNTMGKYKNAVESYGKENNFSKFTGGAKRPTTDVGEGDPGPSTRQKGNDGRRVQDLGAHGFEVEGGEWEMLFKVQCRNPISTYCVTLIAIY